MFDLFVRWLIVFFCSFMALQPYLMGVDMQVFGWFLLVSLAVLAGSCLYFYLEMKITWNGGICKINKKPWQVVFHKDDVWLRSDDVYRRVGVFVPDDLYRKIVAAAS